MSRFYLRHCSRDGKTLRITISLEKRIETKIQELHKSLSSYTGEQWSMSKVINMLLLSGLLAHDSLSLTNWQMIKGFGDGMTIDLDQVDIGDYVANLAALKQMA